MVDPAIVAFFAVLAKFTDDFTLRTASREEHDVSLLGGSIYLLDQQIFVAEPADFSDNTLVQRHRPFPIKSLGRILDRSASEIPLQGKHIDRYGRVWRTRLGIPVTKGVDYQLGLSPSIEISTHFITKFWGYGEGSNAAPVGL